MTVGNEVFTQRLVVVSRGLKAEYHLPECMARLEQSGMEQELFEPLIRVFPAAVPKKA